MDKNSKVPLYLQLMEVLIKKIEGKEYVEHDQLPSERELCDIYKLSRITVRQALQDLEREGYIYKLHGIGTFVASKSYNQNLVKLYSFTNEMEKLGKKPTTEVLSFSVIVIDDRLAKKMNLNKLEEVFKIIRLRYADGIPLMYETSYLPKKIFPNLTEKDLNERPMYEVFHEDYQIGVTKATERFSATLIQEQEAFHLNVKSNQPGMLIKRYAYYHDELIEYTISVALGDKFSYTVELT
ncbi:GntR family transcriptional regulator [Lysinibacillus mangiferihumi]|uniref:GntR family transcriptional regulator n=1 Tax=Lysinibacillus mangiferihumi TaxID=1130819 RepID=A0A4V5TNM6_9BACI|nr:GntR family transcriptional regulator [Lysinibacillus mangiferihumi]TKI67673.1 GntR family transcriptional regulator [Lysinibacillus mangiferihumi]